LKEPNWVLHQTQQEALNAAKLYFTDHSFYPVLNSREHSFVFILPRVNSLFEAVAIPAQPLSQTLIITQQMVDNFAIEGWVVPHLFSL